MFVAAATKATAATTISNNRLLLVAYCRWLQVVVAFVAFVAGVVGVGAAVAADGNRLLVVTDCC